MRTLQVSASYFELDAATPDGNRFAGTTNSPLVAEDTNGTADVYVADLQPADTMAPAVTCAQPDTLWRGANVSLDCTASDLGSGLANADDASFTLSTSVPAGSEDANASTDSRQVCDNAGNCATAGPIAGIKIDRKPPEIVLASRTPANEHGWNNDDVTVEWTCNDTGSGPVAASVTQTLSAEAANQSTTGTCEDRVGNKATDTQGATSIDKTSPPVTVTGPQDGHTYLEGQSAHPRLCNHRCPVRRRRPGKPDPDRQRRRAVHRDLQRRQRPRRQPHRASLGQLHRGPTRPPGRHQHTPPMATPPPPPPSAPAASLPRRP